MNLLPPHPTFEQQGGPPTDLEITTAINKLKNNAPGESGIPATIWKCFAQDPELFNMLKLTVIEVWMFEVVPAE